MYAASSSLAPFGSKVASQLRLGDSMLLEWCNFDHIKGDNYFVKTLSPHGVAYIDPVLPASLSNVRLASDNNVL